MPKGKRVILANLSSSSKLPQSKDYSGESLIFACVTAAFTLLFPANRPTQTFSERQKTKIPPEMGVKLCPEPTAASVEGLRTHLLCSRLRLGLGKELEQGAPSVCAEKPEGGGGGAAKPLAHFFFFPCTRKGFFPLLFLSKYFKSPRLK